MYPYRVNIDNYLAYLEHSLCSSNPHPLRYLQMFRDSASVPPAL
jgi:hypothetical protein